MSESENEHWSDVDNFPLHTKLVWSCLNRRNGKKREHAHIANVWSNEKIKLQFSKILGKKKVESSCFNQELYKKISDDFIIEFGSELADLKENFMTFTKCVHDPIENCNKTEDHAVNLAREMIETGQQTMLMGERMNEINHRITELEQERTDPPSQGPSFAEILRTASSAPNLIYTPSSPLSVERIEKLEYTTSEVARERKLLQVKVTHPGLSAISSVLD